MTARRSRLSRRGFLGLAAASAGCTGVFGRGEAVSILGAGSLQSALQDLASRSTERVQVEAMGSAAAMRLVASGKREPDVLALADTALFDALETWYDRIATNELAVAYTRQTAGGRAIAGADRWFEPILDGRARLGRTDPTLDPLGYRTLFMVGLAADHYDRPALEAELLAPDQVFPETGLLSQFETGGVDAAVVYESMAVDREYPAVDLPAKIDLSDPTFADSYVGQSYTLPEGTTVRGGVIEYGATLRTESRRTRSVYDALVGGDLLADHGFAVPGSYPVRVLGETADGD